MSNQTTKSELTNSLNRLNALEMAISSDYKDITCILNIIKGDKEQVMRAMKNLPTVSEGIDAITTTNRSSEPGRKVDIANDTKTAASSTYNGVIDLTVDNEDNVIDLTEWDVNDL